MEQGNPISFEEYAAKRDNSDFVRDFNQACSRHPHLSLINDETGDQAIVNKGFLDSMFFDASAGNDGDEDEARFAFLASD